MASVNLLVVDHHIFVQLVSSPLGIGCVSKVIGSSNEHGDRNGVNLAQVDCRWSVLAIFLLVDIFGAPVIEGHVLSLDHLSVVDDTLNASTSWEMSHIDLESIDVVERWILGNQERLGKLAEAREEFASLFGGCVGERSENVINMNFIKSISENVSNWRKEFEKLRLSVGQSCNWGQSNENIDSVFPLFTLV